MLRTQSLIGGLNMHKGYAMYYHVEMSEISRVNLQIGLHNEKVQHVYGNFMEHHKKRRGSGEPIQCAIYGTLLLHCNHHDMLFVCQFYWPSFLGTIITSYPKRISTCEYKLQVISQPVLFIAFLFSLSLV